GEKSGRTVCTYSIVDDRGATASGKVMITIDPEAPLLAPVLTDDLVDPADVAAKDVIDVPVLDNDFDPDGDITKAMVSVPPYGAPVETAATVQTVDGKQVVRVHVGDTLQTIRYQVTDTDQ